VNARRVVEARSKETGRTAPSSVSASSVVLRAVRRKQCRVSEPGAVAPPSDRAPPHHASESRAGDRHRSLRRRGGLRATDGFRHVGPLRHPRGSLPVHPGPAGVRLPDGRVHGGAPQPTLLHHATVSTDLPDLRHRLRRGFP
jgi:hypothetical protein